MAVNDLTSRFADQPSLPTQIAYVADVYMQRGLYEQAEQFDQYVRKRGSENAQTLWAKAGQARKHIVQGNDNEGEALFQKILADYAGDPQLPGVVSSIAEAYYLRVGRINKASGQELDRASRELSEEARAAIRKAVQKWDVVTEQLPADAGATPQRFSPQHLA